VRYVLDASVALRWYLAEEQDETAESVCVRVVKEPALFAAPELFAYEVFAVLVRTHPRPWRTFQEGVLPLLQSGVLRYPLTEAVAGRAARFASEGLSFDLGRGLPESWTSAPAQLDRMLDRTP
jgi:predicted nucleic acid-binding protein